MQPSSGAGHGYQIDHVCHSDQEISVDFGVTLVIVSSLYITDIPRVGIDSLLQLAIPSLCASPAATTAPCFRT